MAMTSKALFNPFTVKCVIMLLIITDVLTKIEQSSLKIA